MSEQLSCFELIVSRLEAFGVHKSGANAHRSKCPACNSANNTSLKIFKAPNGLIWMHCKSLDCGAQAIMDALELPMSVLFGTLPKEFRTSRELRETGAEGVRSGVVDRTRNDALDAIHDMYFIAIKHASKEAREAMKEKLAVVGEFMRNAR